MEHYMVIWMFTFLLTAAAFDWRDFRIPNWLTGAGALVTIGICLWKGMDVVDMAAGFFIPFILCIGLFYLRCLGGGDIKLLMVCGIPLGTYVTTFLITAFFWNGIYAVIFLWKRRSFHLRISYFCNYISKCLGSRRVIPYQNMDEMSETNQIHFSTGVLLAYVTLFVI